MGSQDGLQNGPRSAQDGSKRVLNTIFFALENRLNFGLVLGPILVDFGLPKAPPCWRTTRRLRVWKLTFFGYVIFVIFWSPPRRPKRRPRGPKTPPRAPQEAPKSAPGGSKRAQDLPRSPQEAPKRHRRRIRSPKSMYPKGLAPNRKKKEAGGRR